MNLSQSCAAESDELQWQEVRGGKIARLPQIPPSKPGFAKMQQTGIVFTNSLPPERLLENQTRFGGCGIAAGDIDGDGRCDLFFCSLEGRSHLYRNLGNWKFEEITASAGVSCEGSFTSGAVLADVDGDGDLDLLVNAYGGGTRLFLNDGHGHFQEQKDCGLIHKYGATSMALADIDGNGTLDLYVANYATTTIADNPGQRFTVQRIQGKLTVTAVEGVSVQSHPDLQNRFIVDEATGGIKELGEADILYLNKGGARFEPQSWTGGRFLDQSGRPLAEAPYDWGLSAAFRDFNGDGLPDLYVCNDLFTPDRAWTNTGGGIFKAVSNFAIRHMSDSCMGMDFADINRDGIDDFLTLEMLSRDHRVRTMQVVGLQKQICRPGEINTRPAYNRNMLFLGRGDGTFAEIAQLANLDASDWSWSPVFLDVDLDGFEDVLVATGYFRDSLNADLKSEFDKRKAGKRLTAAQRLALQHEVYPLHKQPNVAFRNKGDLTFEEAGDVWGFNEMGVSQGMCLADLDNDGDLDVIVSNFGAPPTLYRNDCSSGRVAVRLKGAPPNTHGIGSKIQFQGGPVPQSQQMMSGGRYLSCDDAERVFATGGSKGPFVIEVTWSDRRHSVITNVQPNSIYEIDQSQAQGQGTSAAAADIVESLRAPASKPNSGVQSLSPADSTPPSSPHPFFSDKSDLLDHVHRETSFNDFDRQPLLPRKLSQAGPALGWADVDQDGWPDLLIGGGRSGDVALFINNRHGGFTRADVPPQWRALKTETAGILAIPFLGPLSSANPVRGNQSAASVNPPIQQSRNTSCLLLVAQSNYEQPTSNSVWQAVYGPSGVAIAGMLPGSPACPGPLAMADLEGAGKLSLFVGGRVLGGKYPIPASSMLYKTNPSDIYGPDPDPACVPLFKDVGLVNAAIFSDLDGDGYPDLILAADWGPLRIFHNNHGTAAPTRAGASSSANPDRGLQSAAPDPGLAPFTELTTNLGFGKFTGWWNSVQTGDFDGDGRLDIVAGNWGRNTKYERYRPAPIQLYYADWNHDGEIELLETARDPKSGRRVALEQFDPVREALPWVAARFSSYSAFGDASIPDILADQWPLSRMIEATTLESMLFLNRGDHFEPHPLPIEAQFAPVFGICVADFDGDGFEDIFLAQNFYPVDAETSRCDAGRGLWLRGDGHGGFTPVPGQISGIEVYGDQRAAAACDYDQDGRVDLLVSQNGGQTRLYHNENAAPGLRVRLAGLPGNPTGIGAQLRLLYSDHQQGPIREVHAGGGYWSQDDATQILGKRPEAVALWVRWPGGKSLTYPFPPSTREITVHPSGEAALR